MKFFRSRRFWIALFILTGLFLLRLNPFLIAVLLFGIAFLYNAKTVRPLKNYKFWIVIIFLVLIVPLFTGVQDKSFLSINYSSDQLQKTIFMTLRGISVFLMFQVLTIDLDIEKIYQERAIFRAEFARIAAICFGYFQIDVEVRYKDSLKSDFKNNLVCISFI